eukprot:SAG22_NODE_1339_length_4692_cov_4.252341_5_plen_91_part_00
MCMHIPSIPFTPVLSRRLGRRRIEVYAAMMAEPDADEDGIGAVPEGEGAGAHVGALLAAVPSTPAAAGERAGPMYTGGEPADVIWAEVRA